MAFHLEGPWLTTTGKKKGPRRWASAEAKRKAELLQEQWEQRLGNFKKMAPKFSRTPAPPTKPAGTLTVTMRVPPGRETPRIESRDTGWVPCVKHQDTEYTGTKAKEDVIKMEGVIEEVLPNTMYRVRIENFEKTVLASLNGRMRMNNIKVLGGDVVELEFSPYDLTRGRITRRR